MTFYEAALRVLESEGHPLHFQEITEKSIAQNLLSHIGKTPEQTMLSRLAAMARRTRDRKVLVTAKDTFALADWGIAEDPAALAQTGVPEPNPEEDLPPLRPAERHPEPRGENLRNLGRGIGRRRDEEDRDRDRDRRRRRFPPISEVVFEILDSGQALTAQEIVQQARERELASEDLGQEQILTALLEDNQRRIDAGRRPQFALEKDSGKISLERAGAPSEAPSAELQAAFAAALGIPLEGGRPLLPRAATQLPEAQDASALYAAAKAALKDHRRAVAKAVRRKLAEVEAGTFEKAVVKMLHGLGFKELKVAKRSSEGPLLTARKREGSVDLRFAVRILRGAPALERKDVKDLRRDLSHYSAQVGLLCCAGDVRQDARGEAQAPGNLVMLWCGEALGEKFLEANAAVKVAQVELYELDEAFFEEARADAEEAARRREERQRERKAPEAKPAAEPGEALAEGAPEGAAPEPAAPPELEGREDEEEGEEGEEDLEAAEQFVGGGKPQGAPGEAGQAGERKRRRRRRRGRRGRGPKPEGQAGAAAGEGGAEAQAAGQPAEGAPAEGAPAEGAPAEGAPSEAAGAPAAPAETPAAETPPAPSPEPPPGESGGSTP